MAEGPNMRILAGALPPGDALPAAASSGLDALDPRARLLCGLAYSLALSSLGPRSLVLAAPPVLLLLLCGPIRPLLRTLLRLNAASLIMVILLVLTYPSQGLRLGLLVVARLNLISIVLFRMVLALGPGRADAALSRLGLPEKLRALLLLTLRGIFILAEGERTALTALHLRAPKLRPLLGLQAFASLTASSLLQGADRSARMALALELRGGLAGFAQARPLSWRRWDTALCLGTALYLLTIGALRYAGY